MIILFPVEVVKEIRPLRKGRQNRLKGLIFSLKRKVGWKLGVG